MARQEGSKEVTTVASVEKQIKDEVAKLSELRGNTRCYPLLLTGVFIRDSLVDDVYDDLRTGYSDDTSCLEVIVDSGGGDIDATYNLALLFRRFGREKLTFIVPRWAKSAATLLVCAGDNILMTPVAELGPLDPQITVMNPLEDRMEEFSPLHIESTLSLIREEYKAGNKELADGLLKRLQFPLTLGSFKKSLELGSQYLVNLLSSRMLKDNIDLAKAIGEQLTQGYADHTFCIDIQEAQRIGLKVEELLAEQLGVVWNIHRLTKKKHELEQAKKRKELRKRIKELPPELLEKLPEDLVRGIEKKRREALD